MTPGLSICLRVIRLTPGLSICLGVIRLTPGLSICLSEMQQKDQEREALDRKVKELGEKREQQEREQAERRKQSFSRSGEHICLSPCLSLCSSACLFLLCLCVCAHIRAYAYVLMCIIYECKCSEVILFFCFFSPHSTTISRIFRGKLTTNTLTKNASLMT